MRVKNIHISQTLAIIMAFMLLHVACSIQAIAESTATFTQTSTKVSTDAPLPTYTQTSIPEPTNTSVPTDMATSTSTMLTPTETEPESNFQLPIPSGTPVLEWQGIPIMPEAIAGDEDDGSYSFTVEKEIAEIQLYYKNEMRNLGWSEFAVGQGDGSSLLLMFQMGTELVTISILELEEPSLSYVLIVR